MKRVEVTIDKSCYPKKIQHYFENVKIYNSSCSIDATTLYLEGNRQIFLKSAPLNSMKSEFENTKFLNSQGFAPKVLEYMNYDNKDFLITERIQGEDGIWETYMKYPKKLAKVFGESLKLLHSISIDGCPNKNRTLEIIEDARKNIANGGGDMSQLEIDFNLSPKEALIEMEKLAYCGFDDVILHGDYCLPNIIMDSFNLSGFIDLGYGGVGDRHWDIYWGIWTLKFNLGTNEYKDIFLESYGLGKINEDRLRLCGLLAGLTG